MRRLHVFLLLALMLSGLHVLPASAHMLGQSLPSSIMLLPLPDQSLTTAPSAVTSAHATGWQTITNAAGYQFQVPSTWTDVPPPSRSDSDVAMIDNSADTLLAIEIPILSSLVSAPSTVLFIDMSGLMKARRGETSYSIMNAVTPVQVTGADAAVSGAATFVSKDGVPTNRYVISAVLGASSYDLILDVAASYDQQYPSLAQTILGSYQITSAATMRVLPMPPL